MRPSVLPPAELRLVCAGNEHRIRWADGGLSAPDHPQAERERALIAIGAPAYPCLSVLDRWTCYDTDLEVLTLAPRGPADALAAQHESDPLTSPIASAPHGGAVLSTVVTTGRRSREASVRAREIGSLLHLGGGLPSRLVLGVISEWCDRIEREEHRVVAALPVLQAALYGRVRETMQSWLGRPLLLELAMISPDEPASVTVGEDRVEARLPWSWLRDVWCAGTATMWGRFVAGARGSGDGWELVTVDALGGPARTTTISL